MSQWQQIETAPRDGTVIDLWAGARRADCFWWVSEDCDDDSHWRQEYAEVGGCSFAVDATPTHWMPLPEPPK